MRRYTIGLLLGVSVCLALGLGIFSQQSLFSASPAPSPTVGTPVVTPPRLHINQATLLTVTSRITTDVTNPVVPDSVKLESLDADSHMLENLGTIYDDGTHGDAVAGDGVFTLQVTLLESTLGTLRLRVAATFRAGPGRIASGVTLVPIVTNTPPVASAGPDQTVLVGATAHLDGSQSSDVDGDALRFQWTFTARPTGSAAQLSDPTAIKPTFVADRPGRYTVQLIVNDGIENSLPTSVQISTENSRPTAKAGANQSVMVGTTVHLDGSQSSDPDGDALHFQWTFTARPTGSTAQLSDPTAVQPTFVVDRPGTYTVQLIVNDGIENSLPTTVQISTENSPPVAKAGANQTVVVGTTVSLDGSQSSDVDGDALHFQWTFTAVPAGSLAMLSDPLAVQPTFVVDRAGTYTVQLIVNDGTVNSDAVTVVISTENSPPVAKAGPDQTVAVGTIVHLDGSQSSDVDGDPLTFNWAITAAPAGSLAILSDPTSVRPTFVVDTSGTYTVQLLVNDGTVNSNADTVVISTINSRPVAKAGPDQTVYVGTTVSLDGSQSSDVDHDPLHYHWGAFGHSNVSRNRC
jgi:PKD domain